MIDIGALGRIEEISTRVLTAPLSRPWGPTVTEIHVVAVDVRTDTGLTGHGFTWTPTIGVHAVAALLDHDIRQWATGRLADAEKLWHPLWTHLHEAGSQGVTTIAMAGLDLALWDLAARTNHRSISGLLGERRPMVSTYGSGVNLHYSLAELEAQVHRWVDAGHTAVKVKVGKPDLDVDIERIASVRRILGPNRQLMIDANQRWDLDTATTAMTRLAEFAPEWIEEPLRADDLLGHRELRQRIGTPIALGENIHTLWRFREFMELGAVDIIQPNVVRVGGITPFREIADEASKRGIRLAPHLLPELSGQLALTLDHDTLVEDVEGASFAGIGLLSSESPIVIDATFLRSTGRNGLGLDFIPAHESIRIERPS